MPPAKSKSARKKQKAKANPPHPRCRLPEFRDAALGGSGWYRAYALFEGFLKFRMTDLDDTKPALAFVLTNRNKSLGQVVLPACACPPGTCKAAQKALAFVDNAGIEATSYLYTKVVP